MVGTTSLGLGRGSRPWRNDPTTGPLRIAGTERIGGTSVGWLVPRPFEASHIVGQNRLTINPVIYKSKICSGLVIVAR